MAKTILVVDDSESMRSLVRLALERAGYSVLEASDGRRALAQLETAKVHLILCDVNMPNMNGLELLGELKQHGRYRFVPVVMLTTEDQRETIERGRTGGAKAWIVKPFNPPQLLDTVSKLVLA